MIFSGINPLFTVGLWILAMAFGAIATLIGMEVRKTYRRTKRSKTKRPPVHGAEEMKRRQDLVAQLIDLYSGVHSVEALSDFLNKELENRHKPWRVRILKNGPGEIYDLGET